MRHLAAPVSCLFSGITMSFHKNIRSPFDFVPRRWERIYRSFATELSVEQEGAMPVRVVNFSKQGFLVECDRTLPNGTEIQIIVAGIGSVKGKIMWSRSGQAGGTFEPAVCPDTVHAALDKVDELTIEQS